MIFNSWGRNRHAKRKQQPFFKFYGYDSISSTEIMILRIYAFFFVFNGINSIIRSFFTYSLRSKLATVLAILKDFILVVPIGFLCQNMLYLSLHPD